MLFALFSAFMMILLLSACASVLIVHHNGCKQAAWEPNRRVWGLEQPLFRVQAREGPEEETPKRKKRVTLSWRSEKIDPVLPQDQINCFRIFSKLFHQENL